MRSNIHRTPSGRKSTNPFDSSDEESMSSSGNFYECIEDDQEYVSSLAGRSAPIDFDLRSGPMATPILAFTTYQNQPNNIFSPLQSELKKVNAEDSNSISAQSASNRNEPEGDDGRKIPEGESQWARLMKIAKAPFKEKIVNKTTVSEPEHGQLRSVGRSLPLSRQSSSASFLSAKSVDNDFDFDEDTSQSTRSHHTHETETPVRTSTSILRKQRTPANKIKNPMLKRLDNFPKDREFTMDYRSPATPWTHLILLEDLGTASSWAVLLLPYIAFLICLVLDANPALRIHTVGPMSAAASCVSSSGAIGYDVPLHPTPTFPCSYPFTLSNRQGILSYGSKSYSTVQSHYRAVIPNGSAFSSGPISNVPAMSNFLYGDVLFQNISTSMVALVAHGAVISSVAVLQKVPDSYDSWTPVKITKPTRLSMKCSPSTRTKVITETTTWDCSSPRIIDILFAEPGTAILTGADIQVNVLFSHIKGSSYSSVDMLEFFDANEDFYADEDSYVFSKMPGANEKFLTFEIIREPDDLIADMVESSSYLIEHERLSYETVKIVVRLITLTISLIFITFWCWSLGMKGFFSDDCKGRSLLCRLSWKRQHSEELPLAGQKKKDALWWESPWLLLPERRYLLALLFCLLLIQNPLLAIAYFHPWMYSRAIVRSTADALMGIGVHGILMMWLCLFQGLRYHSASIARKRAKQQRQVLELRRAARYVAQVDKSTYGSSTEDSISKYTASYYEQYGDIDGSGFAGDLHLRMKHDPCGDNWADFLLPKLFLFACGVGSVVLTAIYRFPSEGDNAALLRPSLLHRYSVIYVFSSFMQLLILFGWVTLIIRNAYTTGAKQKKEPFLSTRPAQLAYRVLLGILLLGIGALAVPFFVDAFKLIKKWNFESSFEGERIERTKGNSALDVSLRVLFHATQRFPYSGTAASLGPGKILFVTTCALVAAFIFLPSRSFYEDNLNPSELRQKMIDEGEVWNFMLGDLGDKVRQRRDKRIVVTLARYTHTWRVFPLPIKKATIAASDLYGGTFHLDQKFRIDYTQSNERGVGYIGRYTPVFCVETACWLLEAAWQSYYSPEEFSTNAWAPGRMQLENIGLRLETAICDESTHTQAIVATNIFQQVDGDEDSIIVVAFRGTINATNLRTDLNWRQVPLPETILGMDGRATFRVHADHVDASGSEGWGAWLNTDTLPTESETVSTFSPRPSPAQESILWKEEKPSGFSAVSRGAKAAIRATPIVRQNLPCVHEGFLSSYQKIRQELWESLLPVLQRQLGKAVSAALLTPRMGQDENAPPMALPKIYITGHSLGGSLGQLLALDLASNCEIVLQNIQKVATAEEEFFSLLGIAEAPSPPLPTQAQGDSEPAPPLDCMGSGPSTGPADIFHTPPQIARKRFFADGPSIDSVRMRNKNVETKQSLSLQPPISVYSYGQPRVGNRAFARLYKQRVPHTFRVVNEGDITTSLPNVTLCGGLYKHAGLEVMLDEGCTGNILVGPTVVETLFRFTKVRTSVTAHALERYRECLESSLGQDELHEYYNTHGTHGTGGFFGENGNIPSATKALPDWVTQIKRSGSD